MNSSAHSSSRKNYGIALLRTFMCFEVILCHFWTESPSGILILFEWLKEPAASTFIFLAFFFTKPFDSNSDHSAIKKRIWRLVFPQIGWAFVYWFAFLILRHPVGISDLLWQIATGHSPNLNPSMWFQFVLLVISILFFIVFKLFTRRRALILLYALTVFSIWFQYSGYNSWLFGSLRYELKYPLGRIVEMIPYATLGLSISIFKVFERLQKNRGVYLVLFGILSFLFLLFSQYIPAAPGFGYSNGIHLPVVFCIAGFAYLIPLDSIPTKVQKTLQFATNYTLGIYCIHRLIGYSLNSVLFWAGVKIHHFLLCFIIYLLSFIASFIIAKISPKYLKQMVE